MAVRESWPASPQELRLLQEQIAELRAPSWRPTAPVYTVAGCFACFARAAGGSGVSGEAGWAGAALALGTRILASAVVAGVAAHAYEPGLLALREGSLLEAAVRALPCAPEVLLINATGRDHPRRAGLALHLGAMLGLPSVGVTHRPLLGHGEWPADEAGACSPLLLGHETVAFWLRTRRRARPLVVHPGWRTDPQTARAVVLAAVGRVRAPEPLREARRVARSARAGV